MSQQLFHYVIQIDDREFIIEITPEGLSRWDDHTGRRSLRHPRDQYLELWAFAGDMNAFLQLQNECAEFMISASVPEDIRQKAAELAEFDTKRHRYFSKSVSGKIAEMDDLLTAFFWKEINPLLSQPIHSLPPPIQD